MKDVLFEPVRKTQEATSFKAVAGPQGSGLASSRPAVVLFSNPQNLSS